MEFIDLFLACTRIGAVFVPMNVLYRERELRHIVTDAAPRAIVMSRESDAQYPDDAQLWCEPDFRVEEGDPAEQIINFAERELPDLIVLGLPRDKDFSTHFQTGVTYKVIASAPCPVLTVREILK